MIVVLSICNVDCKGMLGGFQGRQTPDARLPSFIWSDFLTCCFIQALLWAWFAYKIEPRIGFLQHVSSRAKYFNVPSLEANAPYDKKDIITVRLQLVLLGKRQVFCSSWRYAPSRQSLGLTMQLAVLHFVTSLAWSNRQYTSCRKSGVAKRAWKR